LIAIAGLVCAAMFGATWLALGGTRLHSPLGDQELYKTESKPTADGLSALPSSYDKIKPLGPPLPGDLGPPVVAREKSLGVSSTNLRPDPEEEAARAERMRLAQQARQAQEAGVFFRLTQNDRGAGPSSGRPGPNGTGPTGTLAGFRLGDPFNTDSDPGRQQRKMEFLGQSVDPSIYNPHTLQDPVSPHELLAGTIISGSLITGLNSDLPGLVVAQVTENIFDTVTGQTLLIPQGARLIGNYDSVIAFGQSRALLVWQRIVMPDGSSIQIDNLPATDTAGYSGLEDQVDYHTWALLKGVVLSTMLGVGTELSLGHEDSDLVRAIRQSAQSSINQAGQRIAEKNLNIQPTITVRPGWPLCVVVHKDLILGPYEG
jgi:type IV secretion system protein VirB10